jgi:hypothetical protein
MRIRLTESVRARGTEQADGMLGGQLFGPEGKTTPEYWIDGRPIRALLRRRQSVPCAARRSHSSLCAPSAGREAHQRGGGTPAPGGDGRFCNQRATSKPTVTLTRNVSSPLAIGTGAAIAADPPCARIGTGGANPESSVIHSTRPGLMPDARA